MTAAPAVALSMLTLVPGGMGGSETYARELTRALAGAPDVSATSYVPATAAGFSAGIPERVAAHVTTGPSTGERLRALAEARLRSGDVLREMRQADVVHFPFTVSVPRPSRGQGFIQTLLDVQHLDLPHLFSRAELAYRRVFYEGASKRADLVITISEFAKQRIVELLRIAPERVRVAPLGVDLEGFTPNRGPRESFVLYPARGWPHKNHRRLIEAMEIVRLEHPDMSLVLTGGDLDRLGELPEWVDRRGLVSGDELRGLYRSAATLAFPSLYEGFGLPPIEAFASGCPVAASDAGSIPEVCGDAAVLFDPLDPGDIAAGILESLATGSSRIDAGLAQAHLFTWDRCKDVHVTAYRDAA